MTKEVKRGGFQKGRAKTGGRKIGVPNKSTVALRVAMLMAATGAGGEDGLVGYLTALARERPRVFLRLLVKILPRSRSRRMAKTPST